MYETLRSYRQIESALMVPTQPWWLAGAAVDMDFSNGRYYGGTLSELMSTSRASTGYVTNGDGTMTSFASNAPRIGVGTGLLVEEARTNILVHSNDWTTDWVVDFLTFTQDTIAPDGTVSAWTVNNGLTNNLHRFYQIFAADAGTRSFYAKAGTANFVSIATDVGIGAVFDLSLGTISSSSGGTATITPSAFGFYRIGFTPTVVGTSTQMTLAMGETAGQAAIGGTTYVATGKTIFVCFAQLETAGAFPTSYIPTAGVSATRAADNVSLAGVAFSAVSGATASAFARSLLVSNTIGNPRLIGFDSANAALTLSVTGGNSPGQTYNGIDALTTANSSSLAGNNKVAVGWSGAGRSVVLNGGTVVSDAELIGNAGTLASYVGSQNAGLQFLDGYIPRIALWNSRLSDATLQALTAA